VFGFFGWILFRLSGDVALRVTKKYSSFHVVCEEGIGSLCDRIVCRVTRLQRMFICTVALPMGRRHMVLLAMSSLIYSRQSHYLSCPTFYSR
jgi:hypothetical protein